MFQLCCRTCLEQTNFSELRSIFDTYDGFVIRDALFELFQIEVRQTDMLSTICKRCVTKLCTARNIRAQFAEKNHKYRQMTSTDAQTEDISQPLPSNEEISPTVESTTCDDIQQPDHNMMHSDDETPIQTETLVDDTSKDSDEESSVYVLERVERLSDQEDTHQLGYKLKLVTETADAESDLSCEIVEYILSDPGNSTVQLLDSSQGKPDDKDNSDSSGELQISYADSSLITVQPLPSIEEAETDGDRKTFYNCKKCHTMYDSIEELKEHIIFCKSSDVLKGRNIQQKSDVKDYDNPEFLDKAKRKTRVKQKVTFTCSECGEEIRTRRQRTHHLCKLHVSPRITGGRVSSMTEDSEQTEADEENKYECHICSEMFARKSQLVQHGKLDHEMNFKIFAKDTAPEPSSVPKRKSVQQKRFHCRFCPKSFVASATWIGHENMHTKQQSFDCLVCGKAFAQYTSMRRHMKIHNEVKSHVCDFCGSLFRQRTVMLAHRRRHTGEKPYQCDICHKSFRDHSTFSKHKRVHQLNKRQREGNEKETKHK